MHHLKPLHEFQVLKYMYMHTCASTSCVSLTMCHRIQGVDVSLRWHFRVKFVALVPMYQHLVRNGNFGNRGCQRRQSHVDQDK